MDYFYCESASSAQSIVEVNNIGQLAPIFGENAFWNLLNCKISRPGAPIIGAPSSGKPTKKKFIAKISC